MDADVIVVGAGLAGLVAACELVERGKRVLFVEEIQSDWGQAGKKQGFRMASGGLSPTEEARFQQLLEDGRRNLKGAELIEFESLIARRNAEAENRLAPPLRARRRPA